MAAFAGYIEAFDELKNSTERSVEGIHGIAYIAKELAGSFKKFASETSDLNTKFRKKNAGGYEGTVAQAMEACLFTLDQGLSSKFAKLAQDMSKLASEIENGFKDPEKTRKQIFVDQAAARKEVDSAIATSRKAKEAYHKAAKEAVALRAKASPKAGAAEEKAKEADTKYRAALVDANQRQQKYYNIEHKTFLDRIQVWEENRIAYTRTQLTNIGNMIAAASLPTSYTEFAHIFTKFNENINVFVNDFTSKANNFSCGNCSVCFYF